MGIVGCRVRCVLDIGQPGKADVLDVPMMDIIQTHVKSIIVVEKNSLFTVACVAIFHVYGWGKWAISVI
jgi:hypothetical protein